MKATNEKDELGRLAANFNNLLERLERSFGLQKMFMANASHELRTPVTNIIGEIEVAVSKDRTAADYKKTLQSVLAETDRLNTIIRNFLVLANAENKAATLETDLIRFDELLWELKDAFNRQNAVLHIVLDNLPEDEKRLYRKTNKTLLSLALSNIIQNGIKFSNAAPVTCSLHFSAGSIIISVADQGIGMDADTVQNIFEPFYRRTGEHSYQGHGIGLYIAQETITLLGGSINVKSSPGEGSVFNIVFKQVG